MITFTKSSQKGVAKLGELVIHTPALVIPTNLYSVRHLTRDMFDQVLDPQRCILEVYYEDVLENWPVLKDLPMPFKKFTNLEGYAVWLALRETRYFANTEKFNYINSDDTVSCVNHGGVCKLPVSIIKEMSRASQPNAIIAPVDHFELPGTLKRVNKSLVRTEKYKTLLSDVESLIPSVIQTPKSAIEGIVAVSGLSDVEKVTNDIDNDSTGLYIRGSSLPFADAITLLRQGRLHFFDATHILDQAERGFALNLPATSFDAHTVSIEWLDMNEKRWEADTTLLCEGCPCPGCQFMKSYVHHLFYVREMLGPAVLTAHNLFQMRRFLSLL